MEEIHQSRNLTVSQTLDEILGLTPKRDTVSSSGSSIMEKNSIHSPCRPPTRHGRESASSNEENKDPNSSSTNTTADSSSSATRKVTVRMNTEADDDPDDEFLQKLNEMRRRSLISMDHQPSTSSQKDKDKPESRLASRLPIHVEVEEVHGGQTPLLSPSVRPASPNLTFRVEENEKKTKPPIHNGNGVNGKEKKPKSNSAPPRDVKTNEMFEKSMFHRETTSSDSHHSKWLKKKLEEQRIEKEKKLKEEENKKLTEKERRENAAKLFQRWKADRDDKIRMEKEVKMKKEKEKQARESEEKERKKVEAQKNFEMWKLSRSKSVTDMKKKLEEDEEKKRKQKEIEQEEKKKEAKASFEAWLAKKKEHYLKNEEKKNENKEDDEAKEYRKFMAQEAYETWLEMKDQERDIMAEFVLIEAPPVPWIPPSNMVPRKFVKSANGKRRSQSAKSATRGKPNRPATTSSLRPFR